MRIERRISKAFNSALLSLFVLAFAVNLLSFFYEARVVTSTVHKTVLRQVMNIAEMAAKNGDLLYLQMHMNSVLEPVADNLGISIDLIKISDGRSMVSISPSHTILPSLYNNKIDTLLEITPIGLMKLSVEIDMSKIVYISLFKMMLSFGLVILGFSIFRFYINKINSENLSPVDEFSEFIRNISSEDFYKNEILLPQKLSSTALGSSFNRLFDTIRNISIDFAQIESSKKSLEISRRVAHDIRSPLSILNALASGKGNVDEIERKQVLKQVFERINQIADDLLRDTRPNTVNTKFAKVISSAESVCDLRVEINNIVREKSIEWMEKKGLNIRLSDKAPLGSNCSICFPASELARIVSNLINNAAEASGANAEIFVEIWNVESQFFLKISDFGHGIPEDVLNRLKREPVSSKETGSGIGVYSANEILMSFGHSMEIKSRVDVGTQVLICFS